MFKNPFRKKKEDIYEVLLPGEKSLQEQPFTSAKQTVVQQQQTAREHRTDEQIINLVGRDEELEFLDKLFLSEEDLNVLYNGSPAAAKTMILKAIQQRFPDQCYWFDFSLITGKGFIQLLEIDKRNTETNIPHRMLGKKPKKKILLINEIDKIKPLSDLNVLLDLLDGRTIDKVVFKKEYHIKFDEGLRVFATCNNLVA
jgi:MoxR-like ATPase